MSKDLEELLCGKDEEKHASKQYSFYVPKELYEAFMAKCRLINVPGSRVVRAFMRDFLKVKSGEKNLRAGE